MPGWNISMPRAEYFDYTTPGLQALINEAVAQPIIALDTETTGLVVYKDIVLYWSLSWPGRRITLNVSALPYFRQAFADQDKTWIFANAKFDLHMCANMGITIAGKIIDTCVMHALLYEDMPHGLKFMAKHILNWGWTDFQDTFGKISKKDGVTPRDVIERAEKENFNLLVEYAANDAYGTFAVYEKLRKQLEDANTFSLFADVHPWNIRTLWDLFSKIEMPYTRVLYKNERNGIKVNRARLEEVEPKVLSQMAELDKQISKEAGWLVNVNSDDDLRKLIFDQLGIHPTKMTRGGKTGVRKPSTDKDVRAKLAEDYPIIALIDKRKKLGTFYTNFLKKIGLLTDQHDRVHTRFNQDVARTGRLSSSVPNMQNIPTLENDVWQLRKAFIPERGNVIIAGDYCVAPWTKVLTSDLRWVKARNLKEGDELIGFDEHASPGRGNGRKFRRATVQRHRNITRNCYRVTMSNGTVLTSSEDHLWLAGGSGRTWKRRTRSWVKTKDLEVGDYIAYFCEPWKTLRGHDVGYLQGILDGEGWCSSGKVGIAQCPNPCLDHCKDVLDKLPLEWSMRSRPKDDVQIINFYGNKGGLKALGSLRPYRLLPKAHTLWEGKRTWNSTTPKIYIERIEYIGAQPVIAMQTSTKTFIADGFLSHNSQLEMRLVAAASMEPDMIDVFLKGWDIHMGNASLMFEIPYEEIKEAKAIDKKVKNGELDASAITERVLECLKARAAAKNIGFGMNYGMGAKKLANDLGISVSDARAKIAKYKKTYPAVTDFYAEAIAECEQSGFAFTVLGRRRSIPEIASYRSDIRSRAERVAVNTPIQGSAADVTKMAQIMCDKANLEGRYGVYQLLQVHDEIVFEGPAETAEEAREEIKDWMEHSLPHDLVVPLTSSIGIGPSWGQAH